MKKYYVLIVLFVITCSCAYRIGNPSLFSKKDNAEHHIKASEKFNDFMFNELNHVRKDSLYIKKDTILDLNIFVKSTQENTRAICVETSHPSEENKVMISEIYNFQDSILNAYYGCVTIPKKNEFKN